MQVKLKVDSFWDGKEFPFPMYEEDDFGYTEGFLDEWAEDLLKDVREKFPPYIYGFYLHGYLAENDTSRSNPDCDRT